MPKSFRVAEFIKRLNDFGVIELPLRGKGSERYLVRPIAPGTTKGPSYTLKSHGNGDTVKTGTMLACLRRLGIDPKAFF